MRFHTVLQLKLFQGFENKLDLIICARDSVVDLISIISRCSSSERNQLFPLSHNKAYLQTHADHSGLLGH